MSLMSVTPVIMEKTQSLLFVDDVGATPASGADEDQEVITEKLIKFTLHSLSL
jgi:hypothetical protein